MLETAESVQDMSQGELSGRQLIQLLHTYSSIHQHSLATEAISPYCGSPGPVTHKLVCIINAVYISF